MSDTQMREDGLVSAQLPGCGKHSNQSLVTREPADSIFYLEDRGRWLLKTFTHFYQTKRRNRHGSRSEKL